MDYIAMNFLSVFAMSSLTSYLMFRKRICCECRNKVAAFQMPTHVVKCSRGGHGICGSCASDDVLATTGSFLISREERILQYCEELVEKSSQKFLTSTNTI